MFSVKRIIPAVEIAQGVDSLNCVLISFHNNLTGLLKMHHFANPISSYTVQSWFPLNSYHQVEAEIQLLEEDLDLRKVRMEGKKKSSMFGYLFIYFHI